MALSVLASGTVTRAQSDFEHEPISYFERATDDPVARLQDRLNDGTAAIRFDDRFGYLPAVLEALGVSPESQMLVFSKTSFQQTRIAPHRPRAVYFNDHSYVGWVQGGDVVELSTVDPQQGAVFYTLRQEAVAAPRFVRDKGQCISCHASSRTQGVPGHLVRSVYTSPSGQPHFGSGTFTTDHRSPFEERWGGWYVTGTHGHMRHMGNELSRDRDRPEHLDRESGANVTQLASRLRVEPYMRPTSDIVALMVLEHQTQMHNAITLANYTARCASHQDRIINEALERPADRQSDSTKRRIASAGDSLLEYMLFCNEFKLSWPIEGVSIYSRQFADQGPRDSRGRSLRDFDLSQRIFRYPCSYLIYSESFSALPETIARYVSTRLYRLLVGEDTDEAFDHLTRDDRQAIYEILVDTKPDLFREVKSTDESGDEFAVATDPP